MNGSAAAVAAGCDAETMACCRLRTARRAQGLPGPRRWNSRVGVPPLDSAQEAEAGTWKPQSL